MPVRSGRSRRAAGSKSGFGCERACATVRIRQRRAGERAAVGIQADGVERRIDDAEGVLLGEERVRVVDADLQVVNALDVGDARARPPTLVRRRFCPTVCDWRSGVKSAKGSPLG